MLKAIPFYLQAWVTDPFVQGLNAVQTGIYWKLLILQAEKGAIPADFQELSQIINVTLPELTDSWAILAPKFRLGADGLYRNPKMQAAVEYAEAQRQKAQAVQAAQAFREARKGYHVDDLTVQKILDGFPRRNGNPKDGHTRATTLIRASIRSDEDLRQFLGAVENYREYVKKTYRSRSDQLQFTKRIDRWMEAWGDWVADRPTTQVPPEPIEIPEFRSLDEELNWKRKKGLLPEYPPGSRFPWEPRMGAPDHELKALAAWTDEMKRKAIS